MSQITNTVVFTEYDENLNHNFDPKKSFYKILLVNTNHESALLFIPLSILTNYPAARNYVHEEESPDPQVRAKKRQKTYAVLCHEIAQLKPLKFCHTKLTGLAFTKLFPNFSVFDFFVQHYKPNREVSVEPSYERRSITGLLDFLIKQEGVPCKKIMQTLLYLSRETSIDRSLKTFNLQMEDLIRKYNLNSSTPSILIWELIVNKIIKNSIADTQTKELFWCDFYATLESCTQIVTDMMTCYNENVELALNSAIQMYNTLIELITFFNNHLDNFCIEESIILEIRNSFTPLTVFLKAIVELQNNEIEKIHSFHNHFIQLKIYNLFKTGPMQTYDAEDALDLLNVIERYQKHFKPLAHSEINETTELTDTILQLQENFQKRALNLEIHLLCTRFHQKLNNLSIYSGEWLCFKVRNFALMNLFQEIYYQEIMDNFNNPIFKEMNLYYRLIFKKLNSVKINELSKWSLSLKKQKYPLLYDLIISLKKTWGKMKMTRLELTNKQLATKLEDFRLQHERGAIEEATQLYLGIAEILKPYLTEWVTSLKSLNSIVSEIQEACTFLILHPRLPKGDILHLVEDFKVLNQHFLSLISPVTKFFNFFICLLGNQNPENATQRDQLFADFSQEEVFNLELFSEDVDSYQNLVQEREQLAEKCADIPQEFQPPSQEEVLGVDELTLKTGISEAFSNLKTRRILQDLFQLFNKHGIKFDLQPSGQGGSHRLLHIGNKLVLFPKHTTWKTGTSLSIQKLLKQAIETQTALLPAKDKTLYAPTK